MAKRDHKPAIMGESRKQQKPAQELPSLRQQKHPTANQRYNGPRLYSKKTRKIAKKMFSEPQESMVKKLSFDGSGLPQDMCPQSCQKAVKKWSQPRPGTTET